MPLLTSVSRQSPGGWRPQHSLLRRCPTRRWLWPQTGHVVCHRSSAARLIQLPSGASQGTRSLGRGGIAHDRVGAGSRPAPELLERLDTVTEALLDGFMATSGLGTILFFNNAAEKIFGYTRKEVIGRPVTRNSCRTPSGLTTMSTRSPGLPVTSPLREFPEGDSCPAPQWGDLPSRTVHQPDSGERRTPLHRDHPRYHRPKLAEDALRASEERYRELSDLAPVGVFKTDALGDASTPTAAGATYLT